MDSTHKYRILGGITLAIFGLVAFFATVIHAVYYDPEQEMSPIKVPETFSTSTKLITTSPTTQVSDSKDLPERIEIPSINVDAKVQTVGITLKGNMAVPNNFTDTGWYKYGTIPGNLGSAVIDGHVDNGLDLPGVFKHLKEVKVGGDIFITNSSGKKLHFIVTDIKTYYYTSLPLENIFHASDGARLNIITCDGTWLPDAQTDDHRVVVYSKLVN